MSKLNIINIIIRIENFMCLYRNYSVISVQKKYLVIIYILVVISAHLFSCILSKSLIQLSQINLIYTWFTLSYNACSITNNMVAIISSCYNSELFQIFITNVDEIHIICENDVIYQESMKKLNKPFIKAIILYFGIIITLFIVYCINGFAYFHDISFLIQGISDLILQFRYFWGNLAFHLLIEVLVGNMEYLNSSISAATNNLDKVDKECEESLETPEAMISITKELEKWGDVSGLLVVAFDCLSCTFGLQITLSLWCSVMFHIMLLYQAITFALNKELVYFARGGSPSFVIVLMAYFLTKLSVLWSGQRAHNQARRLDEALARLHVRLLPIPGSEAGECARATVRLAQRLRAAPLRLCLLSSLTIQMALLVEIFGVVANYTIVLLQFNHVV